VIPQPTNRELKPAARDAHFAHELISRHAVNDTFGICVARQRQYENPRGAYSGALIKYFQWFHRVFVSCVRACFGAPRDIDFSQLLSERPAPRQSARLAWSQS
jgi:hypothetical protein